MEKLGRALKFSSSSLHHHTKSKTYSDSLSVFRSKVFEFITQIMLKPEPESKFLYLTHLILCFELIHVTNRALGKLALELDYPMSDWGSIATEEHLNCTLILLEMLNSINASLSSLNRARLCSLRSTSGIKSPLSVPRTLNPVEQLRFESPVGNKKECLILEALMLSKKVGMLALGMVQSGLCSDVRPYMEIRESAAGFNDPETKVLDSKFISSMIETEGFVNEVKAVNVAMDQAVSRGSPKECDDEVKTRLEVLEGLVTVIENNANKLFSDFVAARNESMDHLRMEMNKH